MGKLNLRLVYVILYLATIILVPHALYASVLMIKLDTGSVKAVSPQKPADKPSPKKNGKPQHVPQKSEIVGIQIDQISLPVTPSNKQIRVDNKVLLLISNPQDFLLQRPTDRSDLILYADGFPLKGITSTYFSQMSAQDAKDTLKIWPVQMWIPFMFKRDSTTKDAWNSLFRLAHWNKNQISFNVSLGWAGMFPLSNINEKLNTRVTLLFYYTQIFWVLLFLYFVLICYFIWFCHSSGLIRDPDLIDKNKMGPYSLSQTQLAFWTVIIIGGFIYLIILTGLCDSLNDSCLLLLGISGGTTGIASFIDYYKKQSASQQPPAEAAPVLGNQANPEAQENPAPQGDRPIQAVSYKIHRSFILDILSDGINVSVQRTQITLWNLVLGIYFVWYVISNKSMPIFSNTLLMLAGVSSLLYLTGKAPENPTPKKPGQ
jgi:hypothetical protein